MTVAVLGAAGILGRSVVKELGEKARPLTRFECDVSSAEQVKEAIEGATLVVNCAAWTDVNGAETNEDAAFRANAVGAENAAKAARARGIPLVHVSTGFVFDGTQERPYDKFDPPNPTSVYARSKWAGEVLATRAWDRVFVVRLQYLYGTGGRNFLSSLRRRMLAKEPLKLDASKRAQPTWSGAAARQILALAETDAYGVYHATCAGQTTWAEFGRAMATALGVVPYWDEVTADAVGHTASRPKNDLLSRRMLGLRGLDRMPDWSAALLEYLEEAKEA